MSDEVTETESDQTGPGRPRVGITADNVNAAWRYLDRMLQRPGEWGKLLSGGFGASHKASEGFNKIAIGDADALDDWCQEWLTELGWQRLQAAVRQQRRRARQHLKSVTVSQGTLYDIQRLAERDGVTQEELIQRALEAYKQQESEP